jgi:hypothetical protein
MHNICYVINLLCLHQNKDFLIFFLKCLKMQDTNSFLYEVKRHKKNIKITKKKKHCSISLEFTTSHIPSIGTTHTFKSKLYMCKWTSIVDN